MISPSPDTSLLIPSRTHSTMPQVIWNFAPKLKMVCVFLYTIFVARPPPSPTIPSELLDAYLNGPRTLSNDCLSYLIISRKSKPTTSNSSADIPANYDILICATHFLGDGMALHQFANDFFALLGSPAMNHEFMSTLSSEWQLLCGKLREQVLNARPHKRGILIICSQGSVAPNTTGRKTTPNQRQIQPSCIPRRFQKETR